MLLRNEKAVKLPPELRFSDADIGITGKDRHSWRERHMRFLALAAITSVFAGTGGGGYLGYRSGEKSVKSAAQAHREKSAELRSCISVLKPYTRSGVARVKFSTLSEQAQTNCNLIGLADSFDNMVAVFQIPYTRVSQPEFDFSNTVNVEKMQYDANVEAVKAEEDGTWKKVGEAAIGGFLGFIVGVIGGVGITEPKAFKRAFKNFADG